MSDFESPFDAFITPQKPRAQTMHVLAVTSVGSRLDTRQEPHDHKIHADRKIASNAAIFDVTTFGKVGLNCSSDNQTIWSQCVPFNATSAFQQALLQAGRLAARDGSIFFRNFSIFAKDRVRQGTTPYIPPFARAVVYFPPGVYHIEGSFSIPDGVFVEGAGRDVTAIYFAYDTSNTAPVAYFSPSTPKANWGFGNLSVYILGFFYTVFHIPSPSSNSTLLPTSADWIDLKTTTSAPGPPRFRAHSLTIRADAFHCRTGEAGQGTRPVPWWLPGNSTFGCVGGYQNTVFRFGNIYDFSGPTPVLVGDNRNAVNVAVTECDVSSSWNIIQGTVQYGVFERNVLFNGGMPFYLEPHEVIIDGNTAVGSSVVAGGNGLNFCQHLFMGNNNIRNVHGNDREVMTLDAEESQFIGSPSFINASHIVAPNCLGRFDMRYEPTDAYGNSPGGGLMMILDGPGAGLHRRVVQYAMSVPGAFDKPCAWTLDRPLPGDFIASLGGNFSAVTIAITLYAGRSVFVNNTFSDAGPFQLYHSGIDNVVLSHTLARMEGMWSSGMGVGMRYAKNNTSGPQVPNPAYFNEFEWNTVTAGHRASHQPKPISRTTFWTQTLPHNLFSFGLGGQGYPYSSNRFTVFRGNKAVGGNGVLLWGVGNQDVLVTDNNLQKTTIPISIDQFPAGHDAVTNYVLYNNTV